MTCPWNTTRGAVVFSAIRSTRRSRGWVAHVRTEPLAGQDKFDVKDSFGQYGKFFVGGPLLDSLLWFTDFHHLLSPVSGRIVAIYDYPGSYNYDFYNFDPHNPSLPRPPGECPVHTCKCVCATFAVCCQCRLRP